MARASLNKSYYCCRWPQFLWIALTSRELITENWQQLNKYETSMARRYLCVCVSESFIPTSPYEHHLTLPHFQAPKPTNLAARGRISLTCHVIWDCVSTFLAHNKKNNNIELRCMMIYCTILIKLPSEEVSPNSSSSAKTIGFAFFLQYWTIFGEISSNFTKKIWWVWMKSYELFLELKWQSICIVDRKDILMILYRN